MDDDTEDNHLRDAWNQAVEEYEKATGKILKESKHEDLRKKCEQLEKTDHVTLIINSARQVVKVADLAAKAVPSMPGGSAIFTALSYLIDTIEVYQKNFTPKKVLGCLQDVEDNLSRVTQYLNLEDRGVKLDRNLQRSTMNIFAACLTLCRLYSKVAEDSNHAIGLFKNIMKAAIRWDDGLSAHLQGMKRGTEQEISNNIAAIRISDIYTNDKHTRDQHLERLKNYLRPDNKETHWTGTQETLCGKHIPGIGDWVFDLVDVKSWTNHKCHADSVVLCIKTEKGKGKTHLCSQIIHSLTDSCETQQHKESASVGWYFFPGNQKELKKKSPKARNESQGVPIHDALKAVVWQLVQKDRVFRYFVVEVMNSNAQAFSDPNEMWTAVFSNFSQKSKDDPKGKPGKVFYLVLDGFGKLDEDEEKLVKKMVEDTKRNGSRHVQFRLLLSGTEKFSCGGCKIEPGGTDYVSDAELFIEKRALNQWHTTDQEYRMFKTILRKLEKNFRGDFHELEKCLQEVNQSNWADLKTIEEEGEGNMSRLIIQHHLEEMKSKLDADEIAILKELVLCIAFWCLWPSLRQLDAYLSIQLQGRYKGDIGIKLSENFAGLFSVEDGMVFARPLLDCVEEKQVWVKEESLIHFDVDEGSMLTTHFLLKSICEDTCRNLLDARCIFEYTAVYLPHHFHFNPEETVDAIGTLNSSQQEKLGEWLFQALMDQEIVSVWLPKGDIDDILAEKEWVEEISDIGIFWHHKRVQKGFFQRAKWSAEHPFLTRYKTLVDDLDDLDIEAPEWELAMPRMVEPHWLLEASAKVVASQWLQKSKWDALPALKFLLKIFRTIYASKQKSYGAEHSEEETRMYEVLEDGHSKDEVTAQIITEMEKWALSLLSIKEGQVPYNTTHLRIAETCMGLGDDDGFEEAQLRCRLIIDQEPLDTEALLYLSQVPLGRRNEKGEKQALKQLMKIRRLVQNPDFYKSHHGRWRKELDRFWLLCGRTDSVKEALTVCAELAADFGDEPLPSTNALGIAQEWIMRQKKLDTSFEILSMNRTTEGRSILTDLFCSNAGSYDFHEKFHVAVQDRQDLVFETYKLAIKLAKSWKDVAFLKNHYGIALYRSGRLEDAIKAWRQSVDSFKRHAISRGDESQMIFISLRPIVERLGSAYCEIISAGKDSGSASQYIRKLEEDKDWLDHEYPMEVNYIALLLGRVYRLRHKDQKAVDSVRKFMSKAFDLLEDEKPDNDWNGYFYLAQLFTSLADDDNAHSAWSLVASVLESERECDWNLSCAGGCDKHWDVSKDLEFDLYVCRDCPHLYFERDCWKLLQSNALDHRSCSRNHEFLHVSKNRARAVKRLKPDRVLVGRDEVWIEDWLEDLRRRYGIPGPKKGWVGQTVKAFHVEKWKWRRETRTTAGKIRNAVSKSPKFPH